MRTWVLLAAAQAVTALTLGDVNRPVTKVVNMLKNMRVQLEKEGDEDAEVYQKVSCWCETNSGDKTTSIANAEEQINSLTATIEAQIATSSRLTTEIRHLEAEIATDDEALSEATSLRQKELAAFNAEEKDLLQSIGALKNAVTVLGKHHDALAQVPETELLSIMAGAREQLRKHATLVARLDHRAAVAALVQAPKEPSDIFAFKQEYAPQSGAIFGILKTMKETFETNLGQSQKEEVAKQKSFEELKAAKTAEISAGTEQRETKAQELADADSKHAQATQDLEDTETSLAEDRAFMANLKETCTTLDSEWEARQKTRQEEVQAVSEALTVLSSDDAHDTFTRTFNFVQRTARSSRRDEASRVLFAAAKKAGSRQLAALATSVKLDAFTKVTAAIDAMVADLKKQKADEIKHRDFCTAELNENARAQEKKAHSIEQLSVNLDELDSEIASLTKAVATLDAEVAEMGVQLKHAGEDREVENQDFQLTVADQRATQKLLTSALNTLQGFYDKKALLQTRATAGQEPPAGFKTYKKQGGGGVIGMLKQIIGEAAALEKDAVVAETEAQKAYEQFVQDTNKSLEVKGRATRNKQEALAAAELDHVEKTRDHELALKEQEQNQGAEADLHAACDFTLKNFAVRQDALDTEVGALREAKAVLKGASFLQH